MKIEFINQPSGEGNSSSFDPKKHIGPELSALHAATSPPGPVIVKHLPTVCPTSGVVSQFDCAFKTKPEDNINPNVTIEILIVFISIEIYVSLQQEQTSLLKTPASARIKVSLKTSV
jgi:hypothetical protein